MNQPQPTPKPKSYLKWLLIVLGVVILAAVGVYFFYVKGGNVGGVFSLSSPSPTKSTAVSSPTGTGATPTSTKTSTPSENQTSALMPSPSPAGPPAGWKETTGMAVGLGPANVEFLVYIKDNWTRYNQNDTMHGPVFFTSNINCTTGRYADYQNCWDQLAISFYPFSYYPGASNLTIKTYPRTDGSGDVSVGVNKSISEADQKIIFDSFKVTAVNTGAQ